MQPYATRVTEEESQLPTILFVCSMNSVRSPIAAAMARRHFPGRLIARSAGVRSGKVDHFVHQVMEEIGVDMSVHTPHTMDELMASNFDIIITLADDARRAVAERGLHADVMEHWDLEDPSEVEGTRETALAAYRSLRDQLDRRLAQGLPALLEAVENGV
ncbi:arsenate reductase ArsC [Pelagibacterium lacus]|uniref:arsenate reductase ArsC n=1 Tax=Pelagibacterium lacus TaxID=2282655 RepID=UPI002482A1FD|nr:arsenate reductase ArsC [Pelagibacterium lacus]